VTTCPDIKELRRFIQRVAVDLRSSHEVVKAPQFIQAFHDRYGRAVTQEQLIYCLDQVVWAAGRAALKTVEAETRKWSDPAQLPLPLSMQDLKIPLSLPIERNGERLCVTTIHGKLKDGRDYIRSLQGNIQACMVKLTEFGRMWRDVEPLLEANPDWTIGDALEELCRQERDAA
jgi:hypothetical protein